MKFHFPVRLMLFVIIFFAASSGNAGQKDEAISIATYNIYVDYKGDGWAKRRAAVHDYLKKNNFDVLAIQEASELQIGDLAQMNGKYDFFVGDRSDGHRGDQNWYEYVPIFYMRERFKLLEKSSFWISEDVTAPGSTVKNTKFHGRTFSWIRLYDQISDSKILIGNVHIHGIRPVISLGIISDQLKKIDHEGPIILLGDFNFIPYSEAYKLLISDKWFGGFKDTLSAAIEVQGGDKTTIGGKDVVYDTGGRLQTVAAQRRIDYIFVCGVNRVDKHVVEPNEFGTGFFASDHFSVYAEIAEFGHCELRNYQ